MEKESDVQLIERILSGDEAAFDVLVQRHQKSVHALAWRKIGDFHDAEEITQDTFLQVYKSLPTLKDPYKFAGWLYVIANRLCIDRMRQKNLTIQSLEDTPMEEVENASYTHHVSEQQKTEITERRRAIVKTLLKKLPESERTVMTLFYLGEMTVQEISKFLGVSASAIHKRMYRARKRLQEEEALLVQEVLSGVQIPASVSQNIMQRIADIKPLPQTTPKPVIPWIAFGTAFLLLALLLGTSNQYLTRFQRPYSFEAQSEPTVEIIDAPIVLETDAKPSVRNQIGRTTTISKSNSAGLQVSEKVSTPNTSENSLRLSDRPSIVERVENRTYPSVFGMWDHQLLNYPRPDNIWEWSYHKDMLSYHDLFVVGSFRSAQWRFTPDGPQLLVAEVEHLQNERSEVQKLNPNHLLLAAIYYYGAPPEVYPEDWPYWLRDENGDRIQDIGWGELLIDWTYPSAQDHFVQQAVAIAKCGIYDGMFLDWWNENSTNPHLNYTYDEWKARISMLRRMREAVGDDFLIIVNTNQSKARCSAPYINGAFIGSLWDNEDGYLTHAGLQEIESTLLWSEKNLREPQINALEVFAVPTEPLDSPLNKQMMRVTTTLALTHSDGYVLFSVGRTEAQLEGHARLENVDHHSKYYYRFYDAPLGRPIEGDETKGQLYDDREGVFIREFTNGWAVYNRSGKVQRIRLPEQASAVTSGVTGVNHTLSDLDGEIYLK